MKQTHFWQGIIVLLVLTGCYAGDVVEVETRQPPTPTPTIELPSDIEQFPTPITTTQIVPVVKATNTPTRLKAEATKISASVPSTSATPTAIASETPAPPLITAVQVPFPEGDTKNYMLVGVDGVWHPETQQFLHGFDDMSFSSQPWSPDGRQMAAFFRIKGTPWREHLVLIDLETGDLNYLENALFTSSRLTSSNNALTWSPIWSPDGRYLLYAISTEEDQYFYQIVIYDLMLEQEVFISSPMRLMSLPGWSFDSQQIAYIRWDDPLIEGESTPLLETMDVSSQEIRPLKQPAGLSFETAYWSPISRQLIVYIGGADWYGGLPTYGYNEIYLVDSRSGNFEQVKGPSIREDNYYGNPYNPGYVVHGTPWSPDGQSIIYSDKGLLCTLVIASRQETCFTEVDEQLTQLGAVGAEYPKWSPTGDWIGFVMKLENEHCSPVAAIRPDGSNLRFTDLEKGDCSLFGPTWSPVK